jgi:6-phosphogluconolactonase
MAQVVIQPDVNAVAQHAVSLLANDVAAAVQARGRAIWVAAGGNTVAIAYRILADKYADKIAWDDVWVMLGDERCVPIDSTESNWGQLARVLLDRVPVREAQLLRPKTELRNADMIAFEYHSQLSSFAGPPSERPRLDHMWLGVGEDGHTLSLFPGRHGRVNPGAFVVPVHDSPKPPPERISLTFDVLRRVDHCVALVTGARKREVLSRALAGDTAFPVGQAAAIVEASGGTHDVDRRRGGRRMILAGGGLLARNLDH